MQDTVSETRESKHVGAFVRTKQDQISVDECHVGARG